MLSSTFNYVSAQSARYTSYSLVPFLPPPLARADGHSSTRLGEEDAVSINCKSPKPEVHAMLINPGEGVLEWMAFVFVCPASIPLF